MQPIPLSLNRNVFVAILTERGLDALERRVALAAAIADVGVGQNVGHRFAAVVERRQVTGAEGPATGEVDANGQSHPQNKGGDEGNRRKNGMLALQPAILPHLNKPARK
ncbi:MAG: hypothetical protein CL608_00205 [Anaerolineaceae bacterium]|nr:hypothetical protein [Anaerolineaceae bacterium]